MMYDHRRTPALLLLLLTPPPTPVQMEEVNAGEFISRAAIVSAR